MTYVLMGVAGSGKTTIGGILSTKLGFDFYDADNFHSEINIKKMSQGIALTDEDRYPWLEIISDNIKQWENKNVFLACSALKKEYRTILSRNISKIKFICIDVKYETSYKRINERKKHFFKDDLLKQQFETLEYSEDLYIIDGNQKSLKVSSDIMNIIKEDYNEK